MGLPPARPGLHPLVLSQLPLLAELGVMQVMCLENFAVIQQNSELGVFCLLKHF